MNELIKISPDIVLVSEKKLVGMQMEMSLSENKTGELWRTFMPLKNEIKNKLSADLISLQCYQPNHFSSFSMQNQFQKWACVEVSSFNQIPAAMQTLILKEGLYAVFQYKGPANDHRIFNYIYGEWLPQSRYELDQRPHFEVLGEKYKNMDDNSEELIYIPLKNNI
jgi:AraC family transcriptional regulator